MLWSIRGDDVLQTTLLPSRQARIGFAETLGSVLLQQKAHLLDKEDPTVFPSFPPMQLNCFLGRHLKVKPFKPLTISKN